MIDMPEALIDEVHLDEANNFNKSSTSRRSTMSYTATSSGI